MNENIPPAGDENKPLRRIPSNPYPTSDTPSKGLCATLGFLLFLVSGGLMMLFPPFGLVGFVVAFLTLFFRGYRCIFVGYILSVGLLLLGIIVYCAANPLRL